MIAEYTRYRINQDRQAAFEQAYRNAQRYLQASPHCLSYELSHCAEEPERYVLRIEWVSVEEHLQGFRKEPDFKSFFALVQPFFSNIEEMQHYELTDVVGRGCAPAMIGSLERDLQVDRQVGQKQPQDSAEPR